MLCPVHGQHAISRTKAERLTQAFMAAARNGEETNNSSCPLSILP